VHLVSHKYAMSTVQIGESKCQHGPRHKASLRV
jgi:hypothetical protein